MPMLEQPPRRPGRVLVATALIVIGALILVPSGLCSAILGIGGVLELVSAPDRFLSDVQNIWPLALGVLVAIAIGILLIRFGQSFRR